MKSSPAPAHISRALTAATQQINTLPHQGGEETLAPIGQNHQTWQFDTAMIDTPFGVASNRYWMAAVLNRETRLILNAAAYSHRPTSAHIVELVQKTVEVHGVPRLVMCDHNIEIHDTFFVNSMLALGIILEYSPNSPRFQGRVERFFRKVACGIETATQ